MSKKILSVFVALMMVVSMFAIAANAAYYYESEEDVTAQTYTQTWALSEPVDNGDGTYSVDVSLTTNYATGAIQFVVTNTDTSVAAISSVTVGSAITYTDTATVSKSSGKVMLIPDSSATGTITATAIDGVIATIVYTYSGSGSATIAIENDPKSATNPGGSLIAARMSNGDAVTGDSITGQVVLSTGEQRVIGASAVAPTLVAIDGTIGVVDTTRTSETCDDSGTALDEGVYTGYIYGVEPENGETIDAVFEVVGDGYMTIVANEAGSEAGTGTVVEVYDNSDNLVETYVLVIFGDVNGDGAVDISDSFDIELHDNWAYEAGPDGMRMGYAYQVFAGDVVVDGSLDISDSFDIELHDNWAYEMGSDGMRMYQADVMANLA